MYLTPSASVQNWLRSNRGRNSFTSNCWQTFTRYGTLSDRQIAAIERSLTPATSAPPVTANVSGEGFNLLQRSFQHARETGLKRPKLHVGPFRFSLAGDDSRNPGYVYAKANGEYAGKFSPTGDFTIARELSPELRAKLIEIARDPLANAVAHGHATGNCAICSRALSDPESVTRGIGPVCAKRFGWSF